MKRRSAGSGAFGGVLLAALLCAGCAPEAPPAQSRLIILGFDGMDAGLAQEWLDAGLLPNFKRLAESGHFQALATTNPPQSPVAWATFATGEGAGHHGIFDFLRRNPDTYTPEFSISETIPPERVWNLFGLRIPLDDPEVINRRHGKPFWITAEAHGARATVLRVPVTFPPDDIHRMLSGMGVPDLLGTQGTYTFYTTGRVGEAGNSSRVIRVRPRRDGSIHTRFEGPQKPLQPDEGNLSLPVVLQPADGGMTIQFGEHKLKLAEHEWSDWLVLEFDMFGPLSVKGMVRLYLVQGYPRPRLYVSPIQIYPMEPAIPLSSPSDYAGKLAERIGLYHTIGMPEETWSLNEGHLSDEAWLEMEKTILAEREAMFFDALSKQDSELVVGVFVQTDRVSHMFWRGMDEQHPLHDETDPRFRNAVKWIYQEADRILGKTLERLGPNDRLMVISDHGFAPYRWSVHLNRWLIEHGYMTLQPGAEGSGVLFENVDWSQTRAYALGLNGLFINQKGREAKGIVAPEAARTLKAEIIKVLAAWTDPDTGKPVVRRVFDGDGIYQGKHTQDAPDLVIGYNAGYRASWQTTLGGAPAELIVPNEQKWSGDHCIDPALVPGVLFTNFALERPIQGIGDLADYVLESLD